MRLEIPEFSLVCLVGVSGSGKSTFGRQHFLPTEILSSDFFRGMVSDDETDQSATGPAFELLHHALNLRLKLGKLTVVDATNVQAESRKELLRIANSWHALKVAIVLDIPEGICHERNASRPDRAFGRHVIRQQVTQLRANLGKLRKEGWQKVYVLRLNELDEVEIVRERLWSRRPEEHGPFDIVGDVHGCIDELRDLLTKLGYVWEPELHHPEGRKIVFVGDIVDRGPDSLATLRLAMDATKRGVALWVPGNHDVRLKDALRGKQGGRGHGLSETLAQFEGETPEFRAEVADFIEGLVSHALLDDGKLCVAHAGMREEMQGRGSRVVREFALYGETTGEIDEFGLPVRLDWAKNYRGNALVVHGHVPVPQAVFYNNTLDLDTGCCFGGALTALRYPEREIVSVAARQVYTEPSRPATPVGPASDEGLLDVADVLGRRGIETGLMGRVSIREENAIAALEIMSRFATDPRWLVTLPPTMSPSESSDRDGYLEYPTEALNYYKNRGVNQVVCQQKHMGSRALAVICRSGEVSQARFAVGTGEKGVIVTRTGRRFFEDLSVEKVLIDRLVGAAERSGLFEELATDWMVLDLELMPWSAKAVGLLRDQYAKVGAAATSSTAAFLAAAESLAGRGIEGADEVLALAQSQSESATRFRDAYRTYCWTVKDIDDYRLAPFHLLASEGTVHSDKTNVWHMETLAKLCAEDPILVATPWRLVDLTDETQAQATCEWWEDLTSKGGEGMVVKPLDFVTKVDGELVQPAIKCRGPEYLRIIYGPDYLRPENLDRLRKRGLGRKRGLALREFALGLEALERFVQNMSLTKVHECVFGVLALESEPVDPRL